MRQRADRHLPTIKEEENLQEDNFHQIFTEMFKEAKWEEEARRLYQEARFGTVSEH